MEPFAFGEEIRFSHLGEPFLVYSQRTWSLEDGEVLHVETGIWRVRPGRRLEVTVALPSVTEVSEGSVEGGRIRLESTAVGRTPLGAPLARVVRDYELRGDTLTYDVVMATDDVPLTRHIRASLQRVEGG